MFKPSECFSLNAPDHHRAEVNGFIRRFESWAIDSASPIGPAVVGEAIEKLLQIVEDCETDFHILTTRKDVLSCSDSKAPVSIPLWNSCLMSDLMSAIKSMPIYANVDEALKRLSTNNNVDEGEGVHLGDGDVATSPAALTIPTRRIGRKRADSAVVCESAECGATAAEVTDVDSAEFITVFLLAWPFDGTRKTDGTNTNNLRAYVDGALEMPLPPILQQEIAMLKHQLRQKKTMFSV